LQILFILLFLFVPGTHHVHVFNGVQYFMPNGVKNYHGNFVPTSDTPEGCSTAIVVEGFYPLYSTLECAKKASPGNAAHKHVLDANVEQQNIGRRLRLTKNENNHDDDGSTTHEAALEHVRVLASHEASPDSTAASTKTYYMPNDVPNWHGDFKFLQKEDQSHAGVIYSVSGSKSHSCSIRSPRRVGCWGTETDAPTKDKLGFSPALRVISVSAGAYHTCVLTSDGDVQCGGTNFGNTRKPPYSKCYSANHVYLQGNPVCNSSKHVYTQVSASVQHTCGIDARTGCIRCWGRDTDTGRLGPSPRDLYGDIIPKPGESPPFGETHGPFLQVVTGIEHTCGLRIDGVVLCWGRGKVSCPPSSDVKFTRIASGLWHACGVVNGTGAVVCWGRDYAGQVSGAPSVVTASLKSSSINGGKRFWRERLRELFVFWMV
jgi:hypothetical protein